MANTNTTTTDQIKADFCARIPFGSETNYGFFDRFEDSEGKTFAVFKTKARERFIASDDMFLTYVPIWDMVRVRDHKFSDEIYAFYQARPDLLND